MWNYAGYEQLSSVTGEIKDSQKTFVRVLLWNTPMTILTYILPATLTLAALGNWQNWQTGYIVTASTLIGGGVLGPRGFAVKLKFFSASCSIGGGHDSKLVRCAPKGHNAS